MAFPRSGLGVRDILFSVAIAVSVAIPAGAHAQINAFRQAVAETAARDEVLAGFYRERSFEGVWTGSDPLTVERRNALLAAMQNAPAHGLPADRFDPEALMTRLRAADTPFEQGQMEVALSLAYLDYAHSVQSGLLDPGSIDSLIKREVVATPPEELLRAFVTTDAPFAYLRSLPPRNAEYVRLMRAKVELEALLQTGGWGPTVPAGRLSLGDTGPAVVTLRNRLMAMGMLEHTVTAEFDSAIDLAVRAFQSSVGVEPDGIVGGATLEALNTPIEDRLESILVAMERERWMNFDRGDRHIWVNLTDFTASVVDFDRITFQTRSVIGAQGRDRQTPEFSDEMNHMVINPSWYVPRSIIANEYGGRVPGGFQAIDNRGRVVPVSNVMVNGRVSYGVRQPPGPGNALGRVKFMFPNPYNIYLHDTPSRSLFAREVRTFSHGCVRLNDPLEFGYHLLAAQEDDPEGFFNSILNSGAERRVDLEVPIPVHIVYRTATTDIEGNLQFRADVYGRDARIWEALVREGVEIGAVRG